MNFLIRDLHSQIHALTGIELAPGDWAPTPLRALGDVAVPCFKLSKPLGRPAPQIATELAQKISASLKPGSPIGKVQAAGPYLNVFFDSKAAFALLNQRIGSGEFGRTKLGEGKTLVIDFSSPNIAKEVALHHLRSTAIGNALANIAEAQGYKVERINYLGDWGTTHGKLILGLKMFGNEAELEKGGLPYMLDLYVRFNKAEKEDAALSEQAKAAFKKLESGDADSLRIWKLFREISIREFKMLYDRLGIRFDYYDGESLYINEIDKVIAEVESKMGTRISEGALVCDLPNQKIPVLLKKDDGASLYITRDIAAAEDRAKRFHFDLSWYVVAVQQKLHFQQLFQVLAQLGKDYAGKCEHIWFGMLSFGSKTMKSREGNVIFLKDVLNEAHSRALDIIRAKNPDLKKADEVAEMIGLGAILFSDLSQNRAHDISFDWDKALSFEGDTAPFVQYSHARCASLLRRCAEPLKALTPESPPKAAEERASILEHEAVHQLIGDLCFYETYIDKAFQQRDPSQVATAVLNIAKSMNQLYHKIRFLDEKSHARLDTLVALTRTTMHALATGLKVLGISAPQEM